MEAGTQKNFSDVLSGNQQFLLMLPDNVFHYGKGRDKVNIHLQLLLQRIKEIEERIKFEKDNNPDPIPFIETEEGQLKILERDHMRNLANNLLTEQAEMNVYHRFQELLHDEIGFLIHGYLPETYLSGITKRAKQQRKSLASLTEKRLRTVEQYSTLTLLEEKLQDVLGLTSKIGGEADAIFSNIRNKYPGETIYSAKLLQEGIKDPVNKANKLKKSVLCDTILQNLDYDQRQTYRLIVIGLLHYYTNQSGEMDLLICLPEYQAILNAEIKYQLDSRKDPVDQAVDLLAASSKQVNAHDDYLTRVHGQTFSKGWKFLKISAVLPGSALDECVLYNKNPVITTKTLKSKESFSLFLFETLGLKKTYMHQQGNSSHPIYQEYSAFFQRIVGSMHLIEYSQSAWHKVMGSNSNSFINAPGDTESQPVSPTHDIVRTKDKKTKQDILVKRKHDGSSKSSGSHTKIVTDNRHWDMENRPLDAEMTIYLTGQQRSILLNNSKRCLKTLLFGDFGSGK